MLYALTATGCSLTGKALKAGCNYVQRLLVRVQPSRFCRVLVAESSA